MLHALSTFSYVIGNPYQCLLNYTHISPRHATFFSITHFPSLTCKIPHFTLFLNSSNAFPPLSVKYKVSRPYKRTHRVTVVCHPVLSEFPHAQRLLFSWRNTDIALNSHSDHGYVSALKGTHVVPEHAATKSSQILGHVTTLLRNVGNYYQSTRRTPPL